MEIVAVLRVLWRRRWLVALGLVFAVAAGYRLGQHPTPASAVAKTRVVLDTPESQLVTDDPKGAGSLPWRATITAMTIAAADKHDEIARAAGLPPAEVGIVDPELGAPFVPASLPAAAIKASNVIVVPYLLNVYTDDVLPVIMVEASAPDRASARRLAQAAVRTFEGEAVPETTWAFQGVTIDQVGPIEVKVIPGDSGHMKMAMGFAGFLLFWCVALLAGPLLNGIRRTLAESTAQDPAAAHRW